MTSNSSFKGQHWWADSSAVGSYLVRDIEAVQRVVSKERQYFVGQVLLLFEEQLQLPGTYTLCHAVSR